MVVVVIGVVADGCLTFWLDTGGIHFDVSAKNPSLDGNGTDSLITVAGWFSDDVVVVDVGGDAFLAFVVDETSSICSVSESFGSSCS